MHDSASKPNEHTTERDRLLNWVSEKGEGLVRAKYFPQFADGMADSLLHATRNSVTVVILLHLLLDKGLRQFDATDLLTLLHEHATSPHYAASVHVACAKDVAKEVADGKEDYLCGAFFEYYWARLGKLRMFRFVSHRPSRFRDFEMEAFDKLSWLLFCTMHPHASRIYKWRAEKGDLNFLARWRVLHGRFEKRLYQHDWLDHALERSATVKRCSVGAQSIAETLLSEYFPVFWNSLEDSLLKTMFYWSNLGRLAGGKDTDELIASSRPG